MSNDFDFWSMVGDWEEGGWWDGGGSPVGGLPDPLLGLIQSLMGGGTSPRTHRHKGKIALIVRGVAGQQACHDRMFSGKRKK